MDAGKNTASEKTKQGAATIDVQMVGNTMTADMIKTMPLPEGQSLYELGMMYSTGHGREFDLVAAHCWFNIAAAKGDREAAARRSELAAEMSAMDISIAQRAAREWLKLH